MERIFFFFSKRFSVLRFRQKSFYSLQSSAFSVQYSINFCVCWNVFTYPRRRSIDNIKNRIYAVIRHNIMLQ